VTDTKGAEDSEVAAAWFVKSESGEPLGQIYRDEDVAAPIAGGVIEDETRWGKAEVVSFKEMGPTCAMRRFAVVVRVLA
jgi:hypothetical protein